MNNSRFSSLIYRIIGKPDRWHDDYIDLMHQVLDETESFDEPYNFSELAVGDQIISQLKASNEALTAFNTLLDRSRFKMIILDDQLKPVYHNHSADELYESVLNPANANQLHPSIARQIQGMPKAKQNNKKNTLQALDFFDRTGEQIYLRSIQSQVDYQSSPNDFHILMALDQSHQHNELNSDLVAKYELTEKEQMVLRGLIHGKNIKEIAKEAFVSDNTVKTHLKSIFRKTNTNSQTAVVGMILTHESQIMDSYFESDIGNSGIFESNNRDRSVTLSDGHVITYCEYGPRDGRPLLVFHSGYGCRLAIPPSYEQACQRHNRRVIIPDRPGVGKTPFVKGHPAGWNERLAEFINLLELESYDLLGSILGAQMAVSFALHADERLGKVILCAPIVVNSWAHTKHLTGILNPSARLVRASKRFAREIYELWLKSITLNLSTHYRSMLESTIGSAELDQFVEDGTFELLIDVFREGASQSLDGISHEMVYCLSPMKSDLKGLSAKFEIWYGTEDKRMSLDGLREILKDFPEHTLHIREGYSEHIYYALFDDIIA